MFLKLPRVILLLVFCSMSSLSLAANCEIYLDDQDVYHLKAKEDSHLWYCLGHVHAQDRAFQMEFLRRVAMGQMAEVFGHKWIKSDFFLHMLDFEGRAQQLTEKLHVNTKEVLQNYARGVNSVWSKEIDSYQLKQLGIQPSLWEPHHSIMLLLLQSLDQTKKTFTNQIEEQKLKEKLNIFFNSPPWETTILKNNEVSSLLHTQARENSKPNSSPVTQIPSEQTDLFGALEQMGMGSNNWAIDKNRSATGNAFFVNDPHLKLTTPSFWYPVHLEGKSISIFGSSIPGLPLIPSGNNKHLAWGLTNAYYDVGQTHLVSTESISELKNKRPVIWFKWWIFKLPFFFKTHKEIKNDIIILPIKAPKKHVYAVRWSALDITAKGIDPMFNISRAKSVEQIDQILSEIQLPTWNFTFADTQGNIGYRTVGLLPKHKGQRSAGLSVASYKSLLAPQTYLEASQAPHLLKPQRGYVVTANNKHVPDNKAYNTGNAYSSALRANRIEELITKTQKHTDQTLKDIHCDVRDNEAFFIVPQLLEVLSQKNGPLIKHLHEQFEKWDYISDSKCQLCALYRLWADKIIDDYKLTKAPRYPEALWELIEKNKTNTDFVHRVVNLLEASYRELTNKTQGELPLWGDIFYSQFPSLAGAKWFSHGYKISSIGANTSVNNLRSKWNKDFFSTTIGASKRLVVELSSPPTVWSIIPGTRVDKPIESMDKTSPWHQWASCQYQARNYPYTFAEEDKVFHLSWD